MRKPDYEMVGKKIGSLTVISFSEIRNGRSYWNVICDCGESKNVRIDALKPNSTCNKCKSNKQRLRMLEHGDTHTMIYDIWRGIKARCNNPKSPCYNRYGGRGIKICDEWSKSYKKFKDYVSKLDNFGLKGYSLDRINNDGNYEPGNVRWADAKTQANNKCTNHYLSLNGKTQTITQWSRELNIKPNTLRNRIQMGWPDIEVLTRPIEKHNRAV
jgi:hypothetical protein